MRANPEAAFPIERLVYDHALFGFRVASDADDPIILTFVMTIKPGTRFAGERRHAARFHRASAGASEIIGSLGILLQPLMED